ncbi:MAG: hypothetical protein ACOYOV_10305 [Bacteroidales bacterium]
MKLKPYHQTSRKIFILILLFISITASSNAQEFFYFKSYGEYYNDWSFYNPFSYYKRMPLPKNLYKELKVKEQKVYFQNSAKDTTAYLFEQKTYNENGYESSIKRYKRNGKIYFHVEKEYSEKGRILKEKNFDSKGRPIYGWEVNYDNKGNMIDNKSTNHKGMLIFHTVNTFNDKGKISSCDSYYGKKQKLSSRMLYTYYANGDKETTTQLDALGKIIRVWSYACSSDGVERKIKKDTVQVCRIADYNKDGGFTITNRTLNEEGKLERTVSKFNRDSVQTQAIRYDNEDLVVYQNKTTITEHNWETEYIGFYVKQAKPKSIIHNLYNQNKELVNYDMTTFKKNGKIKTKYSSEYNGVNQCLKTIYYKKAGREINYTKTYTYSANGLLNKIITLDENGKVESQTMYQYQN